MSENIELTILMPCLNEENTIGKSIDEAFKFINENKISAEVLIADNGSSDNSEKVAISHNAKVVKNYNKGYGNALITGIKAAKGKYIIMGDCDNSYDFYHLNDIMSKLRNGCDLVMGNRFKGGIEKGAMPFSHKYIGVPLLSLLGRLKYKIKISDFHCGLRGFSKESALKVNLECEGMEFATEMIGKFAKNKMWIEEVPVKLRCDGRKTKSHLRTIPDGIRHLKYIIFS